MAWHLIKSGGDGEEFGFAHKEFLIDSESDISTEPTAYGPIAIGSRAHIAGFEKEYEKGSNGSWQQVVGNVSIHVCSSSEYNHETGIPIISTPETGIFYLVPDGSGDDLFVEWIYVNDAWEKFGSARIDLSGYITGVTVNGTSVVTSGVAAIPKASSSAFGVVKPDAKTNAMTQAVGVDSDGKLYTAPGGVTDVRVNGTSVVQDGVANVPVANGSTPGVVKVDNTSSGLQMATGQLQLSPASANDIKAGMIGYKAIVPSTQNASVFYGLAKAAGDSTQASSSNTVGTYTTDAKTAIKTMLGIEENLTVSGTVLSLGGSV